MPPLPRFLHVLHDAGDKRLIFLFAVLFVEDAVLLAFEAHAGEQILRMVNLFGIQDVLAMETINRKSRVLRLQGPHHLVMELGVDVNVGRIIRIFPLHPQPHVAAILAVVHVVTVEAVAGVLDEIPRAVFGIRDMGVLVDALLAEFG